MDGKKSVANVMMLPWLAHGHISPFLELAKRLVSRNFHIHICSTAINLRSIEKKVGENFADSIELVEIQLPSSPELPPHYHTTNGLPPHLMNPLKDAFEMSAPLFAEILANLHPDFVIYDCVQQWPADVAASQDIPAAEFVTYSAIIQAFGLHILKKPLEPLPFPEIRHRGNELRKFGVEYGDKITDHKDLQTFFKAFDQEASGKILLIKSFREFEGEYLDLISSLSGKKVVPVGPLVQDPAVGDEQNEIIKWLDKKEERSVVFVSFGSEYFLTEGERNEVARGLELSNVNFIWVVRFPNGANISVQDALPEGFLERTSERGKVVEGWAPQARILKHPSVGGFVSHCGWSSVMESMKIGVPIIAMPMQLDQPLNGAVVAEAGVGLEVLRDGKGKLLSEEIAKTIRKVVVDESGEDVRRKAKEMCEKLAMKGDEEIDSLAKEILKVCDKKRGDGEMLN